MQVSVLHGSGWYGELLQVIDVNHVNPFFAAIKHVFATMLSTSLAIGAPWVRRGDEPSTEISASLAVSGQLRGSVVLHLPARTAAGMVSKFAGIEIAADSADLDDGLGELVNMVGGQAKVALDAAGAQATIGSCELARGEAPGSDSGAPTLVLPCGSELGPFRMEVTLTGG